MTRKTRHLLTLAIQITVSAAILLWLFFVVLRGQDGELSDLTDGFDGDSRFWIIAALIFTALSFFAATFRWLKISETLSASQPYRRMLLHFISGQFVSNFLPSSIGGDIVRMTRLSSDTKNPQNSFASVVIDRFFGWPILGTLSLIGFALSPGLVSNGFRIGLTAILISGITIIVFFAISWLATHDFATKKLANSQGYLRYLTAINIGLRALRRNPIKALEAIGVTFIMQFSLVMSGYCIAQALNIHILPFLAILAFLPVVLIVQVLPISVGGTGVREGALAVAFSTVGATDLQALQFGLMLYLLNITVGLFGLPSFLLGGRKTLHINAEKENIAHTIDEIGQAIKAEAEESAGERETNKSAGDKKSGESAGEIEGGKSADASEINKSADAKKSK